MEKKDWILLIKIVSAIVAFVLITTFSMVSCIDATCVKGSLGQCCSQSFPCQQQK